MRPGLTLAIAFAALQAVAGQPAPASEPHPLKIRVGESVAVCKTGTIQCPANNPICDDATVVGVAAEGSDGLTFKGLKPGTTLCSVASGSGFGHRRVYRVTVAE
jgi:hypothetical protein